MPGMLEQQQGATVLERNEQGRVEGDGAERGRQVIPADALGLGLRVRGGVAWPGRRGAEAEDRAAREGQTLNILRGRALLSHPMGTGHLFCFMVFRVFSEA